MATHSSVLAWRIPGTGEPGGLLSLGSHRVGHEWSDLAAAAAAACDLPGQIVFSEKKKGGGAQQYMQVYVLFQNLKSLSSKGWV